MANPTDVVGYAMDGYVLCPSCYAEREEGKKKGTVANNDDEGTAMFGDSEVDFPGSSCDVCNELIDEIYLFQDSDLERVEIKDLPDKFMTKLGIIDAIDGNKENNFYAIYKIKCGERDLSDYVDRFIDIITRVEKIENVGDSNWEISDIAPDSKDATMYIAIFY